MRIFLVAALAAAALAAPAPKQGLRADIRAGGSVPFAAALAYDLDFGRAGRLHASAALDAGRGVGFRGALGARVLRIELGRLRPA